VKEYVVQTMKAVSSYIENDMKTAGEDKTRRVLAEFELKITYFQHERLIHLMVTLSFALFLLLSIGAIFIFPSEFIISAVLLTAIFFGLTVGYVFHYYFLENSVQKMYHMRDEMIASLDKDLKDIGLTDSGVKKAD
jgi:hypothetical protein